MNGWFGDGAWNVIAVVIGNAGGWDRCCGTVNAWVTVAPTATVVTTSLASNVMAMIPMIFLFVYYTPVNTSMQQYQELLWTTHSMAVAIATHATYADVRGQRNQ